MPSLHPGDRVTVYAHNPLPSMKQKTLGRSKTPKRGPNGRFLPTSKSGSSRLGGSRRKNPATKTTLKRGAIIAGGAVAGQTAGRFIGSAIGAGTTAQIAEVAVPGIAGVLLQRARKTALNDFGTGMVVTAVVNGVRMATAKLQSSGTAVAGPRRLAGPRIRQLGAPATAYGASSCGYTARPAETHGVVLEG